MNTNTEMSRLTRSPFFKKIEKKSKEEIVRSDKLSSFPEFLKFVIFLFFTTFIVLVQYSSNIFGSEKTVTIFRKIYLYSIGLSFGDLTMFIVAGVFVSLILNWLEVILNRYYFYWLKPYRRVDYWIVRRRVKMFIWLNLLVFVLCYHWYLVTKRNISNLTHYSLSDLKILFTDGWYKSFTHANNGAILNYPNTNGNIGIFMDSVLNALHAVVISPWLIFLFILTIHTISWVYLLTLKPKEYFKNLAGNKTLEQVVTYLKKINTVYYFTNEVKRYFDYVNDAAKVLEINVESLSFKKIIRLINKKASRDTLFDHPLTSKYFMSSHKQKAKKTIEEEAFIALVDKERLKQQEYSQNQVNDSNNTLVTPNPNNSAGDLSISNEVKTNTVEEFQITSRTQPLDLVAKDIELDQNELTNNFDEIIDTQDEKTKIVQLLDTQLLMIDYDDDKDDEKEDNGSIAIDETVELRSIETQELYKNQPEDLNVDLKGQSPSQSLVMEIHSENENNDINKLGFDLDDLDDEPKQDTENVELNTTNDIDSNADSITPDNSETINDNTSLGFDQILTEEVDAASDPSLSGNDSLNIDEIKDESTQDFTFATKTMIISQGDEDTNSVKDLSDFTDEDDGSWISPFDNE
ncbi:hypothetical protein [Mycoplasma sp. HS2188]|uniref:hypothetical protein n=1 Tax=Mycoplasma sp. HS2188 TaxID=2976765 RepID=UPI0021AAAB76|nr:hypothetical protein [Mycoplasma sp. HS2188]MCT4469917.1 hypothetical protein [Mycoplasma sp. HS2188]